jgi:molybdopterin synthase sulfur carrier subunit
MKVKVLFFGRLCEFVNGNSEQIYFDIYNTEHLLNEIFTKYPSLKDFTFKVAVNQELISEKQKLNDSDEIALMPPFAGG